MLLKLNNVMKSSSKSMHGKDFVKT